MSDPAIFSFSSLKRLKACPGSFKLQYIDRLSRTGYDATGAVPGWVCHKLISNVLERFKQEGVYTAAPEVASLPAVLSEFLKKPNVQLGVSAFASSTKEAEAYLEGLFLKLVTSVQTLGLLRKVVHTELWFGDYDDPYQISDKVAIVGGLDMYSSHAESEPGVLVDFKASKSTFHIDPDQLKMYVLGLSKFGLKVGMCGFVLFMLPTVRWFSFGEDEIADFKKQLDSKADFVAEGDFPFTPSKVSCRLCEMKHHCSVRYEERDRTEYLPNTGTSKDFSLGIPKL